MLGEQPSTTGSAVRCVDSSTERLEIRIVPFAESTEETPRHVRVNGWMVPLQDHPEGGLVGCVRFRTMLLPTCLHPHVMPHTPLEFELFTVSGEISGIWEYHHRALQVQGVSRRLLPLKRSSREHRGGCQPPQAGSTLDLLALL